MNREEETFENRFFAWLNQESAESGSRSNERKNLMNPSDDRPPEGDRSISSETHSNFDPDGRANVEEKESDLLNSKNYSWIDVDFDEPENLPTHLDHQPDCLGEIQTVQQRAYALLKSRLQTEIQKSPPLFPWETELLEYDTDILDDQPAVGVPGQLWIPQLQDLRLPVAVPETLLKSILLRCQQLLNSSLREGEKLVQAVEDLFPQQSPDLNKFAGMVLMGNGRHGLPDSLPDTYETANPSQKMVLSLIAAREILRSLQLRVSASQPKAVRRWLTAAGWLTLEAEYQPMTWFGRLRVQAYLPEAGRLQFKGPQVLATAQRSALGEVSVELFDVQPDQTYSLEIYLENQDDSPLVFSIYPTA